MKRAQAMAFGGGLSVAMLMTTTALAQTAAPATAAAAAAAAGNTQPVLEEIVVTADRKGFGAELVQAGSFRGARALDTPLTINVVPQQVLASQQALTVLDALKNTAGVTQAQTSPTVYNNLAIRGIAVENRGNYRLDSSLPIVNLIDLPLEDKDRVEALKGASALYYGFTTPAGIINMTMKRPTHDDLLVLDLFGNDHGSFGGHVDASRTWEGPMGTLGARVNLVDAGVDSGIDKTYGHRSLGAVAVDLKPTDKLTLGVDFENIEKTVPEPTIWLLTAPKSTATNLYPAVTLPPLLDPKTNLGSEWMKNQAREMNFLVHTNYRINDQWDVTVDGGESRLHRTRRFSTFTPTDLVGGAGTISTTLQNDNIYQNTNYRAEVAGTFYTGPLLHEILFGASRNERTQFNSNSTKVTAAQNFLTPHEIAESPLPPAVGVTTEILDVGYYVFDRIKYQEWLQVLAGVRYSDYTESNKTTNVTTFHDTPTSASYGVVVKPRDWASVYATYIEGLESTPVAPVTAVNGGQQLPPSTSTQWEGGVKLEPFRGLLFQAAYFDIDRASAFTNAQNVFVQDGRARYRGVEASLTGEITADLSVYASAQVLSAKQVSGAPTVIVGTTVTPTSVGKYIENTPKETFSLSGEYRLNSLLDGLSVNGGVFYTGKRALNSLNQAWVPGFTLVNIGAAYKRDLYGHATTFRVNAENVGNKKYWASTGTLFLAEGAPQTVKFQISSEF
jgi:iron complex outermembrane receptor protein